LIQPVSDIQRYEFDFGFHVDGGKPLQTQPCQSKVHLISCLNYTKGGEKLPREYFTHAFFSFSFFGKLYFSKLDEFRFLSICFFDTQAFCGFKKSQESYSCCKATLTSDEFCIIIYRLY